MNRDDEIRRELQSHLDDEADDLQEQGLPAGEARAAARRRFGNTVLVAEEVGWVWRPRWISEMIQDARYALRNYRRSPGFVAAVVISLALGIGANTSIFSILNAVTMRALPVAQPQELRHLAEEYRDGKRTRFSYAMYERMRDAAPLHGRVIGMSSLSTVTAQYHGNAISERVTAQLVTGEFFPVLGVGAAAGRMLTPEDNRREGAHPVAVISHAYWNTRLGGASDVVGSEVSLNGEKFTIVGVAAAGFNGVWIERATDVWLPAMMQQELRFRSNYSAHNADSRKPWVAQEGIDWLDLWARSGDDPAAAQAMRSIYQQNVARTAQTISNAEERRLYLDRRLGIVPCGQGLSNLRQRFNKPLFLLMAMAGVLLLIACANTANLLLARGASRHREIAVRMSMGAGRGRLIRQLMTESLLMVLLATGIGLILARASSNLLLRFALDVQNGIVPLEAGLDARVLAFTIAVSFATVLLFGFVPALRSTRMDMNETLKSGSRNVDGGPRAHLGKSLVAAQVALSLTLVSGMGLLVRSLDFLMHQDLGFEPRKLMSLRLRADGIAYTAAEVDSLHRRLVEAVEAVPGVESAAVAEAGLMSGSRSTSNGVLFSGYQPKLGEPMTVQHNGVSAHYVSTTGMRLLAGRDFNERDIHPPRKVAIINSAVARRYFAGRDPVGQRYGDGGELDTEIIGVVADARVNSPKEDPPPLVLNPITRNPEDVADVIEIRTSADPIAVAAAVKRAVAAVDRRLPPSSTLSMPESLSRQLQQEQLVVALTTSFALLALVLACFGLFGVMSYAVTRRTQEFGLRMALGAGRSRMLWMVMRESLAIIAGGVLLGVPLMVLGARAIATLLYGIRPNDPATIAGAVLLLGLVAAAATLIPAWRASRVDPNVALRYE